jgi:hypothetical protein
MEWLPVPDTEIRRPILTEIFNVACARPELQRASNLKQRFSLDGPCNHWEHISYYVFNVVGP